MILREAAARVEEVALFGRNYEGDEALSAAGDYIKTQLAD